ncbi:MAG TPA: RluA family pseudouridine synthase [Polyangia bacterium]|nr:RluA family pseudouridine synthase [Polyangia bacterium]
MVIPLLDTRVPEAQAGQRLDRVIPALCPTISRMHARRMIDGGAVFVDGRRTGISSRLLRAGQQLTCYPLMVSRVTEEPRIVLSRDELFVVDKPAGMAVEATRSGSRGTLIHWLQTRAEGFVTHRLDAPVSGLIIVARTKPAQAACNRLFAEHAVDRQYLAAVAPPPAWEQQTLEETLDGKPALTRARVLSRAPAAALLEIRLETGRFRQIRRHLAGARVPVIGDREQSHALSASRILLHAFRLSFVWRDERIEVEAPPPGDYIGELEKVGLHAPSG